MFSSSCTPSYHILYRKDPNGNHLGNQSLPLFEPFTMKPPLRCAFLCTYPIVLTTTTLGFAFITGNIPFPSLLPVEVELIKQWSVEDSPPLLKAIFDKLIQKGSLLYMFRKLDSERHYFAFHLSQMRSFAMRIVTQGLERSKCVTCTITRMDRKGGGRGKVLNMTPKNCFAKCHRHIWCP